MDRNELMVEKGEKSILLIIILVAIAVPLIVAILLFMPSRPGVASDWIYFLPHLNAVINSATSLALLIGLVFIKTGKITYHKATMSIAMVLGAIFLISYLIYHSSAESTSFGGEGTWRTVYYFILISHILLAAVALFPILLAYYFGITGKYAKHKKMVKFAYPIWLYVSVTGVLVYWMISPYYLH